MVSARRAARAEQPVEVTPPGWIAEYEPDRWERSDEPIPEGYGSSAEDRWIRMRVRGRRRWKHAGADWYRAAGRPVPSGLRAFGRAPDSLARARLRGL